MIENTLNQSFVRLLVEVGEHKKPGAALLDTPGWFGKTLGVGLTPTVGSTPTRRRQRY